MTNENKTTIELGKQYQTRDGREAVADEIERLRASNAELVAALNFIQQVSSQSGDTFHDQLRPNDRMDSIRDKARSAISRAEGGEG
jgi:hypothetical protein